MWMVPVVRYSPHPPQNINANKLMLNVDSYYCIVQGCIRHLIKFFFFF
jgi:hypothetical protein